MGIPVWKRGAISYDSPYGNRHSPFPYRDVSIPISIWGSLYGNGKPFLMIPHMEMGIPHFHMGMRQSPLPYGNPCMETGSQFLYSPYGNGHSPFPYGDVSIPVSIWVSPYENGEPYFLIPHTETGIPHFHIEMCQSPFLYGDPCMEMGSRFF